MALGERLDGVGVLTEGFVGVSVPLVETADLFCRYCCIACCRELTGGAVSAVCSSDCEPNRLEVELGFEADDAVSGDGGSKSETDREVLFGVGDGLDEGEGTGKISKNGLDSDEAASGLAEELACLSKSVSTRINGLRGIVPRVSVSSSLTRNSELSMSAAIDCCSGVKPLAGFPLSKSVC